MGEHSLQPRPNPELFQEMVEMVPHMVWLCRGEDGQCTYLSPQWVEYTGIPEDQQLGYRWLEQLHPDDVEPTKQRWAAAASGETLFDTEFRIRCFDGSYRWFKTRATPIRDDSGKVVRWVGSNTDIAQLRDLQETTDRLNRELEDRVRARTVELAASTSRLQTVATQLQTAQRITHVGSWELEVATNLVTWSEELFRVFGMDPQQEAPSYDVQRPLFSPPSWDRLTAAVAHSVETGEGYELTLQIFTATGELRTAIARAETLKDAHGMVTRLVGTFQDITAREATREQLFKLTERLQLATSAAHMGVWDWNVTANELVWDDGMHTLYGTTPDAFPGAYETWASALLPEDRDETIAAIERTVTHGAPFDTAFRIRRPDGQTRHIRALGKVHRDESGEVLRILRDPLKFS